MKYLAFDLLIFWAAFAVGAFGWVAGAPVLILAGGIFVVTSIVWMALDIYALMKDE